MTHKNVCLGFSQYSGKIRVLSQTLKIYYHFVFMNNKNKCLIPLISKYSVYYMSRYTAIFPLNVDTLSFP